MIIIAPGELGNQIFSVAVALHISERRGTKIWVLSDNLELVRKFHQITSEFDSYKVRIVLSKKLNLWLNKLCSRILIFCSKFAKLDEFWSQRFRTIANPCEFPIELIENSTIKPWILRGFFQDVNLIQNLSEENRTVLMGLFDLDQYQKYHSARATSTIIGVHIRRGDYRNIPSYGTLSVGYFTRLITTFYKQDSRILVASDDSDLLHNFEFNGIVNRLLPEENTPLETMSKLARADTFLMSNSTFSFWIAWAVCLRGGNAYIPSPWFKESEVPPNFLLLDGFITSTSEFE